MFIGEGPGYDEDMQGKPFVGKAGQLLTKMIIAMGLKREDVYIANIVKCRPPNNRNPLQEEIEPCINYLYRQIEIVNPKIIICLGSVASQALLKVETRISRLRGKFTNFKHIKVMPTFHPSYLLRNEKMKKPAWEDLQMVMKEMGLKND
jgi:DNA polymerase